MSADQLSAVKSEYVSGEIDESELEERIDGILWRGEDPANVHPGKKVQRQIREAISNADGDVKYVTVTLNERWDLWEYVNSGRFSVPATNPKGLSIFGVPVRREYYGHETPRVVEVIDA